MRKKRNNEGNIADILFVLVIFFAIIIGTITTFHSFDDIVRGINDTSGYSDTTKASLTAANEYVPRSLDTAFTLVLFGAFLAIAVAAFVIRSNMAFFFVAVFILAVFVFVAAVLSNTYESYIAADDDLVTFTQDKFRMSNHVMNNIVIYLVIMGFVIITALYAKTSDNVGGGI